MPPIKTKQLRRWAFTAFCEKISKDELIGFLKEGTKAWVFQKERCPETGTEHWQGRVSFKNPKRPSEVKWIHGKGRLSAEHDEAASDFYASDPNKRLDGPWSDKDVARFVPAAWRDPVLKPWQQRALDLLTNDLKDPFSRRIHIVVDPVGERGKSWFSSHLKFAHGAKLIPSTCATGEDMVQALCDQVRDGWQGIVCVDIPRAADRSRWNLYCHALETIKGCILYDKRYHYKEVVIEVPAIIAFCNSAPPDGLMTADRWVHINTED